MLTTWTGTSKVKVDLPPILHEQSTPSSAIVDKLRGARDRREEPFYPTYSLTVLEKVGIDLVCIPWTEGKGQGDRYIVFARDDLTG